MDTGIAHRSTGRASAPQWAQPRLLQRNFQCVDRGGMRTEHAGQIILNLKSVCHMAQASVGA
jgi:hypothetical protein